MIYYLEQLSHGSLTINAYNGRDDGNVQCDEVVTGIVIMNRMDLQTR